MLPSTVALIIQQLVVLIPLAVDGYTKAQDIIKKLGARLQLWHDEDREPTDEEWDEINAMTMSLTEELEDTSRDVPNGLVLPSLPKP